MEGRGLERRCLACCCAKRLASLFCYSLRDAVFSRGVDTQYTIPMSSTKTVRSTRFVCIGAFSARKKNCSCWKKNTRKAFVFFRQRPFMFQSHTPPAQNKTVHYRWYPAPRATDTSIELHHGRQNRRCARTPDTMGERRGRRWCFRQQQSTKSRRPPQFLRRRSRGSSRKGQR